MDYILAPSILSADFKVLGEQMKLTVMTAAACVLLPLISIAVASLLALPYNAVKQFLKPRFLLNFIIVTAITAALFYLYAMLLGAVKEMLLGDELKYFFNERVMDFLQSFASVLYPGKWLANFMLKRERLFSGLGPHEYVTTKMKEGKAIIALCGDDFAGFTYIGKKTEFTGCHQGMRYRLEQTEDPEGGKKLLRSPFF